jgi:hypothetical protein
MTLISAFADPTHMEKLMSIDLSKNAPDVRRVRFSHTDYLLAGGKLIVLTALAVAAGTVAILSVIDILKDIDVPFIAGLVVGLTVLALLVSFAWLIGWASSKVPFFQRRMLTVKAIRYAEQNAPI